LYVVIQKKQGAPSSVTKLTELFGSVEIIERSNGYWVLLAKKQEID
jgi:16S rRNA (guanine1207-N2)-methyltransferase